MTKVHISAQQMRFERTKHDIKAADLGVLEAQSSTNRVQASIPTLC